MTTKVPDPVLVRRWGSTVASPANDADSEYVPAGSFGVMEQVATPLVFVVPVHDCVPFSVIVTGSLAAPADV